jgi:uncharacterized membrane protein YeaQ/YmgE (transglycosylase-associated protein family)
MGIAEFVLVVIVGLIVGVGAGTVIAEGGHGRRIDVALGAAGGVAGTLIALMLGILPDGLVAYALAAGVSAGVVLFAQRKIWPAEDRTMPRAQRR